MYDIYGMIDKKTNKYLCVCSHACKVIGYRFKSHERFPKSEYKERNSFNAVFYLLSSLGAVLQDSFGFKNFIEFGI